MYLYNTTFKVELSLTTDFIYFIQEEIKPKILSFDDVIDVHFLELLNIDTSDGNTYCLQINFTDIVAYNQYILSYKNELFQQIYKRYQDKALHFSSVLKSVEF